ncbi:hypothetical protein [Effusibacillus lacus]|uniref:Cbb3-type cytochrome c oxidase subunit I n=1 Tax=Effusibacillus lacus TaxID=1348429 RepID=A0A292YJN4_9BACL|nr:hypothetical protein [Effusibacillus lacus]TCS75508.1 hypothetical protein EDD64_10765 [Effusibacillus lacus]GAX88973.1 hypothetical protein EFBL_0587 [Effusibacillus lacus]
MNISGVGSVPLLPFRTVLRYVAAGLLGWLAAAGMFLYAMPDLARGDYRTPVVLALVHLVVLGWATMLAQGAMYQLIPVAFQVGIRHDRLAVFNHWIYTAGVAGFVVSFASYWVSGLRTFGGIAMFAVLLFAFNIVRSMMRVKSRNPMFWFVISAVLYLALTALLGISQLLMIGMGIGLKFYPAIFTIHIWAGLIGWFTMLIIGFTYKLFPMFTLSHGFSERRQTLILFLLHGAIGATAMGALTNSEWVQAAGLAVFLAGILLFGVDVADIYKHRMRGKLELPMAMAVVAIVWLAGLVLAILTVRWLGSGFGSRLITALGLAFFLGWLSQTIMGYLYKIVPFLIWNERYADKVGRQPVPMLKDMVNEKITGVVAVLYNAGLATALAGIGMGVAAAVYGGFGLLAVAVAVFVSQMVKVIVPI